MMDDRNLEMTRDALVKLKEELAYLEGEWREKIVKEIATARAHGDLSENAEYHAAKEEQGQKEARIRQLKGMIENAKLVEVADDGKVSAGMVVTFRRKGNDPETYLLGLREQRDTGYDILTPDSPLGRNLLGRSAGESITARTPAGDDEIEILEVRRP